MTKPKTCEHCNHYNSELYRCKLRDIPIGNVCTCSKWIPRMDLVLLGNVRFVEYEQYSIEAPAIHKKKLENIQKEIDDVKFEVIKDKNLHPFSNFETAMDGAILLIKRAKEFMMES